MTRDDGTRRTRAMAKACEGISTEALEAGAVAKVVEVLGEVKTTLAFCEQWETFREVRDALDLIKGEQQ